MYEKENEEALETDLQEVREDLEKPPQVTFAEIVQAWQDFRPTVSLSTIFATRRAIREVRGIR